MDSRGFFSITVLREKAFLTHGSALCPVEVRMCCHTTLISTFSEHAEANNRSIPLTLIPSLQPSRHSRASSSIFPHHRQASRDSSRKPIESVLPTKQTPPTTPLSSAPLRLPHKPLSQKLLIPHTLHTRNSTLKLRFLPTKRQQRWHTAHPIDHGQILNQRAVHLHFCETQPTLALAHALVGDETEEKRFYGCAGWTPGCTPEGDQRAVVGGGEERQAVEIRGLADWIEDAVLVRAVTGM